MKITKTLLATGLILLLLAPARPAGAAAATLAQAAGGTGWSVDPFGADKPGGRSNFSYTLRPGQVFRDDVSITNTTDGPLTIDLYAADAFNTALDGGYALRLQDQPRVDPSPWVEFTSNRLTIEPRTRVDVPFRVSVPAGATPGDHVAGIIGEEIVPDLTGQAGAQLGIKRRIAARLYIRVAGPLRPSLVVQRIEVEARPTQFPPFTGRGSATIAYQVRNAGNTRLNARVRLVLTGAFGRRIHTFDARKLADLLPGADVVLVDRVEGLPPVERLHAEVTATAEGTADRGSDDFWVISPALALLTAVLVLANGIVLVRRRRRRRGAPPADGGRPSGAHFASAERESVPA